MSLGKQKPMKWIPKTPPPQQKPIKRRKKTKGEIERKRKENEFQHTQFKLIEESKYNNADRRCHPRRKTKNKIERWISYDHRMYIQESYVSWCDGTDFCFQDRNHPSMRTINKQWDIYWKQQDIYARERRKGILRPKHGRIAHLNNTSTVLFLYKENKTRTDHHKKKTLFVLYIACK